MVWMLLFLKGYFLRGTKMVPLIYALRVPLLYRGTNIAYFFVLKTHFHCCQVKGTILFKVKVLRIVKTPSVSRFENLVWGVGV